MHADGACELYKCTSAHVHTPLVLQVPGWFVMTGTFRGPHPTLHRVRPQHRQRPKPGCQRQTRAGCTPSTLLPPTTPQTVLVLLGKESHTAEGQIWDLLPNLTEGWPQPPGPGDPWPAAPLKCLLSMQMPLALGDTPAHASLAEAHSHLLQGVQMSSLTGGDPRLLEGSTPRATPPELPSRFIAWLT